MSKIDRTIPSRLILLGAVVFLALGCAGGAEPSPVDGDREHADEQQEEPAFVWEEWPAPQAADTPRPERPDPAFVRRDWLNLNGSWEFTFDPEDRGLTEAWATTGPVFARRITVPFPWGSPLSGVGEDTGDNGGIGWYRRHFERPASFAARRTLLVIGAADWDVSVFVNGKTALLNAASGYLPLKTDISDLLKEGDNELLIRVRDFGNDASYPHGKQGKPWYANVGGIWQTVYLEATSPLHIESVRLSPDLAQKRFLVRGEVGGAPFQEGCSLRAYAKGMPNAVFAQPLTSLAFSGEIAVPWLKPWSPEEPTLQEFEWRLDCAGQVDVLRTYAGLRQVARAKLPGADFEAVQLNGRPVYIRGVLVQGYNAQGLYSYPSEAALLGDLQAAQRAGFNLVRLHIKTEDPLVLYHADRLGLLLDYDIPCYGAFPYKTGDGPAARAAWQATLEGQFRRDFNHPSIIWWTLFNEDWGLGSLRESYDAEKQAFVKGMLARARELDSTRLIEDQSTLRYDHVAGGDINSFHIYQDDPSAFLHDLLEWVEGCFVGSEQNFIAGEKQNGAPLINTEYGPFSAEYGTPQVLTDRDISWGFRWLTTMLRRQGKLTGYVFTELYDVEFEYNGFLDYDRSVKDFGYPFENGPAALNAADFVGVDVPYFQLPQGTPSLTITPFVSHFAPDSEERAQSEPQLQVTLFDARQTALWETKVALTAKPWQVVLQAPLVVPLPAALSGAATLLLTWRQADRIVAQNVLPGELFAPAPKAVECLGTHCLLALDLAKCTASPEDSAVQVGGETQALGFLGGGTLRCPLTLPAELPAGQPLSIWFEGELSANVAGAPQTSAASAPAGSALLKLGETELGVLALAPERADSRGILSHLNGSRPKGSYGERVTSQAVSATLTPGAQTELRFELGGAAPGGLLLYGRRMGRYGQTPLLHLEWTPAGR